MALMLRISVGLALAQTVGGVLAPPTSLPNARCLGGTPCGSSGLSIKPGRLWRSATPANMTRADVDAIAGTRTIIDLRSQKDARKDVGPRLLNLDERTVTHHAPILSESVMRRALMARARARPRLFSQLIALKLAKKLSPSDRLRDFLARAADVRSATLLADVALADVYCLILNEHPTELSDALKLSLAELEGGSQLLVHCTHGKDRTGVLVAMLLVCCGVAEAHARCA
uniref:Tyrosine specific protein phosphatases domain-containing protein n=1 Tax=Haptolina brevifila TaxID=156173 RepID=A0A7S2BL57_9EUKA|mmetsp:Transcript_1405/g.2953  ORF Transcript_1405/g.2953 Transcript_1405/m.2953 type:complete len:229 (+) Transcript_1405:13-699(+)